LKARQPGGEPQTDCSRKLQEKVAASEWTSAFRSGAGRCSSGSQTLTSQKIAAQQAQAQLDEAKRRCDKMKPRLIEAGTEIQP